MEAITRPAEPILEIRDLHVQFLTWRGVVNAVRGVDLRIERNHIVGLIGESGSGKSVTGRSILQLLSTPPGIVGGQIYFEGRSVLEMSEAELDRMRGREITYISQDPLSSLNPVFTVGEQMADAIVWSSLVERGHGRGRVLDLLDRWSPPGRARFGRATQRAAEILARVGLPDPARQLRAYPHQLSGGMRQRVLIALALVNRPKLLIADEPTTALDVTSQAQILNLIKRLSVSDNLPVLYISHDLSVVAQLCDRVAVMYAGRIVEEGETRQLFENPVHPYTKALLSVVANKARAEDMQEIVGEPPDMLLPPDGCAFHPRCPIAEPACMRQPPPFETVEARHWVACPPGRSLLNAPHSSALNT